MTSVSIAAAIALSLVALVGSRPRTAAMALVLSYFFALPVTILAKGANSAVFVCDVVLLAVLLRWGRTSMQRMHQVQLPGKTAVWVLMACSCYCLQMLLIYGCAYSTLMALRLRLVVMA